MRLSKILAFCEGNLVVYPHKGPVMGSFVFLAVSCNKLLNKKVKLLVMWEALTLKRCYCNQNGSWWRHQMETFSALLALCAGNSPVTGEFLLQRTVMRCFDVFFDLHLNKRLSKQSWGWWFEMPSCSLWHHNNALLKFPFTTAFINVALTKCPVRTACMTYIIRLLSAVSILV